MSTALLTRPDSIDVPLTPDTRRCTGCPAQCATGPFARCCPAGAAARCHALASTARRTHLAAALTAALTAAACDLCADTGTVPAWPGTQPAACPCGTQPV